MTKSTVIIGGGISGLSAALKLKKININNNVTVLESTSKLGGWINSRRFPDGSVHDMGPHTIKLRKHSVPIMNDLINSLNIQSQTIFIKNSHKYFNKRYIYYDNQMNLLNMSFTKPFLSTIPDNAITLFLKTFKNRTKNSDETVDMFMRTHYGNNFTDYLIDPFFRGIYASSIKDLSIKSTIPFLFNLSQQPSLLLNILLGQFYKLFQSKPPLTDVNVLAFYDGMQTLIDEIEKKLIDQQTNISTNCQLEKVKYVDNKFQLTANTGVINCDNLIVATPSFISGSLINELSELKDISWVSVAVVVLEFQGSNLIKKPGFGHLIPSKEIPNVLGVIYDSCILPELDSKHTKDTTRLTVMLGGSWYSPYLDGKSEQDLTELALSSVHTQLSIDPSVTPLLRTSVSIQHNCIPVYRMGHGEMVSRIREKAHKMFDGRLVLCGNSYDGVSVPDCIISGYACVDKLADVE